MDTYTPKVKMLVSHRIVQWQRNRPVDYTRQTALTRTASTVEPRSSSQSTGRRKPERKCNFGETHAIV